MEELPQILTCPFYGLISRQHEQSRSSLIYMYYYSTSEYSTILFYSIKCNIHKYWLLHFAYLSYTSELYLCVCEMALATTYLLKTSPLTPQTFWIFLLSILTFYRSISPKKGFFRHGFINFSPVLHPTLPSFLSTVSSSKRLASRCRLL